MKCLRIYYIKSLDICEDEQPYFILGTYTNIKLLNNLGSTTVLLKSSGYQDYKYDSGFGRVEYERDGKYLFRGNTRRDDSSRFRSD